VALLAVDDHFAANEIAVQQVQVALNFTVVSGSGIAVGDFCASLRHPSDLKPYPCD
jgi:hypothetical protein